jgi:putative transposase
MPRARRVQDAGIAHHVMYRGNRKNTIFTGPDDYSVLVELLLEAAERYSVRVITYCLMPNHWHLVALPCIEHTLSAFVGWLAGTHAKRYHRAHGLVGTGHLYQSRYRSIPVQSDRHLFIVVRYVEANPKTAGLVERAEDWPWSRLGAPPAVTQACVAEDVFTRPADWLDFVNCPALAEASALRRALARGKPFGSPDWIARIDEKHGMRTALRPRGRPGR